MVKVLLELIKHVVPLSHIYFPVTKMCMVKILLEINM